MIEILEFFRSAARLPRRAVEMQTLINALPFRETRSEGLPAAFLGLMLTFLLLFCATGISISQEKYRLIISASAFFFALPLTAFASKSLWDAAKIMFKRTSEKRLDLRLTLTLRIVLTSAVAYLLFYIVLQTAFNIAFGSTAILEVQQIELFLLLWLCENRFSRLPQSYWKDLL